MISERVALAEPEPRAAEAASPGLQYAKGSGGGVTRRQMNLLLLFVMIDTLLFAAFVCLPTASPYLKSMWSDYQKRREDARQAAVVQGKLNACLMHSAPADQALYIEESVGANRLLAADAKAVQLSWEVGTREPGMVVLDEMAIRALRVSGWQPPVRAGTSAEAIAWRDLTPKPYAPIGDGETTLYLHEMKTPSGQQRLVVVSFSVSQYVKDRAPKKGVQRHYEAETIRKFSADVMDPQNPRPSARETRMVMLDPPGGRAQLLAAFASGNDPHPVVDLQPGQRWRIFAGQADAVDPTHFTIGYEIEGQAGVIDGRLNDGDRLMLTPRVGRMAAWTSGSEYEWDLTASAAPAQLIKGPTTGPVWR